VGGGADKLATDTAIWLARLERGLQAPEGSQLREWLQEPAHRDSIVAAAKLWHGPDIVAVLAELVPVGFGNPIPPKKKRVHHPLIMAFGICLALSMGAIPFMAIHRTGVFLSSNTKRQNVPWGELVYATRPGETRAVNLQDGSKVTLNSHTRVGVLIGAGLRQAILEYGEAIFQIAPEQQRPFEVNAGGRHFRAPPSMFDIRVISPQSVELLVLDGGVTVQGLPWHWPTSPAEARMFDPAVFADTTVGPLQAALLEDQLISRYPITAANAHERLRWQPEDVVYVSPE
jgi:transmembrane sensor